jgi:hypothetical protein
MILYISIMEINFLPGKEIPLPETLEVLSWEYLRFQSR